MLIGEPGILLREIRKLVGGPGPDGVPDRLLLQEFIDRRDEAAFALLLARHGPMVLAVCRGMLRHEHDAEDAFQATFLVLARKAGSIREQESVGSWLHGVACHLARGVQASARRRREKERRDFAMQAADPVLDVTVRELQCVVSEELCKLPEKYRAPLVLCYLEGMSHEDAARQLECSKGALRGRLNRGRDALRARLSRRGLGLSPDAFAGMIPAGGAIVSPQLADSTLRAAMLYADGAAKIAGIVVSMQAALLAEGMVKSMFASKISLAVTLLLGLSVMVAASTLAPPAAHAPESRSASQKEQPVNAGAGLEPVQFDPNPIPLQPVSRDVWGIAVSPDGSTVASVSGQENRPSEIVLWDVKTRKPHARIREERGLRSVAFSSDGRLLATAGHAEHIAQVRDARTGKVLQVLRGHTGGVNSVAFAPDGRTVATAGLEGTVRLWDPATGALKNTLRGHTQDGIYCVAFRPDSKEVVSCGFDKTARIWDVATGKERLVLEGHRDAVEAVAFSPDGEYVATASWDRTIKLWDPATGKERASLAGHKLPILSIAFSHDGKMLISGSGKWGPADAPDLPGEVKLWDVSRRKEVAGLTGHTDRVWSVAFAPDGKMTASAGWDKTVRLWDVAGAKEIATLRFPEALSVEPRQVLTATYSAPAELLALGREDGSIVLLDATTGEVRRVLNGHADAVLSLAFSLDGRHLASGSADNSIKLWDARSGKTLRTLKGHMGWVYAVAFSADGQSLASGSYDRSVRLWTVATGKETQLFKGHKAAVRGVAFSPDGKSLASACSDRTVKLWNLSGSKEPITCKGHTSFVRAVAFSTDGKMLASAGEDGQVHLWDPTTGESRRTLGPRKIIADDLQNREIVSLTFAPFGQMLVAGEADGTVRLWQTRDGTSSGVLRGPGAVVGLAFAANGRRLLRVNVDGAAHAWNAIFSKTMQPRVRVPGIGENGWAVAFAPDGRTLAAVGGTDGTGTLRLLDPAGKQRVILKQPKTLRCVAYSPDGKMLATGGFDSTAQLRDPLTCKVLLVLKGHTEGINSLCFSWDSMLLLTGSLDRTAKLWDVAGGKEIATFTGHTDQIFSVALSPDGKTAATCGRDRTIRLWDVSGRKEKRTLQGHSQAVEQVVFSPNGKTLASASWDQTVRLWDVASGELRRTLRGQPANFLALGFSPDGKTLATGNGEFSNEMAGDLRLWNLADAQTSYFLRGHDRGIRGICFSANGRTLASIGEDSVICMWDLPSGPGTRTKKSE